MCDVGWLAVLSWAGFKGTEVFGRRAQMVVSAVCATVLLGFGLKFLYDAGIELVAPSLIQASASNPPRAAPACGGLTPESAALCGLSRARRLESNDADTPRRKGSQSGRNRAFRPTWGRHTPPEKRPCQRQTATSARADGVRPAPCRRVDSWMIMGDWICMALDRIMFRFVIGDPFLTPRMSASSTPQPDTGSQRRLPEFRRRTPKDHVAPQRPNSAPTQCRPSG